MFALLDSAPVVVHYSGRKTYTPNSVHRRKRKRSILKTPSDQMKPPKRRRTISKCDIQEMNEQTLLAMNSLVNSQDPSELTESSAEMYVNRSSIESYNSLLENDLNQMIPPMAPPNPSRRRTLSQHLKYLPEVPQIYSPREYKTSRGTIIWEAAYRRSSNTLRRRSMVGKNTPLSSVRKNLSKLHVRKPPLQDYKVNTIVRSLSRCSLSNSSLLQRKRRATLCYSDLKDLRCRLFD